MPETKDLSTAWTLLWKVNQALVPLLVAWGVWVTVNQFDDKAHRSAPHATVPVEMDQLVEMKLILVRLEEDVRHVKEDTAEIKKKLTFSRGTP